MSGTTSLGELISWLSRCPSSATVRFSDGTIPGTFASSRGFYSELALSHDGTSEISADDLLASASACIGKTFTGYRGGHRIMSVNSEVWRDNYGEYTDTRIVGGNYCDGVATIIIAYAFDEANPWSVS
jgi:hypothetical protein